MDDQKKKKMLLALVAVGVLGAGSYYFVLRGDESSAKDFTKAVPTERKKSEKVAETKTDKRKAPKATKEEVEKAPSERKERAEAEDTVSERKKKRIEKQETKKKTLAPAA